MRKSPLRVLWILPLVSLLLVSCLPAIVKPPKSQRNPAVGSRDTFTVFLSSDSTLFTGGAATLRVKRGDTVKWFAAVPWEVDLGINGPTDRRIVSGAPNDTAFAVIRLTAPAKQYKYSVTLRVGDFFVTEDPKLIVEEEGNHGPDGG